MDSEQNDLMKKYKVIWKRYSNLQEKFNENHENMKSLEEQLKCSTTSKATHLLVNLDSSFDQNFKIAQQRSRLLYLKVLRSNWHILLSKKQAEVE